MHSTPSEIGSFIKNEKKIFAFLHAPNKSQAIASYMHLYASFHVWYFHPKWDVIQTIIAYITQIRIHG